LLPTYLAATAADVGRSARLKGFLHALRAGVALALGFAVTLGGLGFAVSVGAHRLTRVAPWVGFAIGIVLLAVAGAMSTGRRIRLPLRLPGSSGFAKRRTTVVGWVVFGVAYGLASLACTIGVLLAVIAQAQATSGFLTIAAVFGAYAAGSVVLLTVLSGGLALAGHAFARGFAVLARHQDAITGTLLALTGLYLLVYWAPAALGGTAPGGPLLGVTRLSTTVQTWLDRHLTIAVGLAAALITIAFLLAFRRHGLRETSAEPAVADGETCRSPCCDEATAVGSPRYGRGERIADPSAQRTE
ncbi:MAG: cytochrome c biogenesis protein CcdA, partial [Acidothermus sp.]|nr:cytochrome c biogenesis protein CcdA [Acidothermus sp.]